MKIIDKEGKIANMEMKNDDDDSVDDDDEWVDCVACVDGVAC